MRRLCRTIAWMLLSALALPLPGCASAREAADAVAQPAGAALCIAEVMSSNKTVLQDAALGSPDWIELYNPTAREIDLSGYALTDNLRRPERFVFTAAALGAGESLLLYAAEAADAAPTETPCTGFALSKSGETLYLLDPDRTTVQELTLPALETDISYARRTNGSYGYCGAATPGADNADGDILASQAAAQTARMAAQEAAAALPAMDADDPIRINEILLDNRFSAADEDGDRGAWVELYNASEDELSLAGYYLSDKPDEPYRWAFPDVPIGPGEYLVVYLSGKNRTDAQLHTDFRLSQKDGVLLLTDAGAGRRDQLALPADIPENVSVGRTADGTLCYYGLPTPGYANAKSFLSADTVGCFDAGGLYLSEVCAASAAKSGEPDWVELKNGGQAAMDLAGWSLTDDPDGARLALSGSIPAGGYLAVPLGDDAPFHLSVSGETLLLSDAEGRLRDRFTTGALHAELTAGRPADASAERAFFTLPTRGRENAAPVSAAPAVPTASTTALYRAEPFLLRLSCASADAEIHYTLDGSLPDRTSPIYAEPLEIEKSTVVRAIACREGAADSAELCLTYLFTEPHTVPVICVAAAPAAITAIFENSYLSNRPEYRVQMALYEADGTLGTVFPADLRIKGNQSSSTLYKQKSVVCHLRAAYGQGEVSYPFFDERFDTVSALTLRNSGQEGGSTRLRDAFCSRIAAGLNVECARTRLVVLYNNGAYHGLYYLTEQMNEEWLADRTGTDSGAIEIVDRYQGVLAGSGKTYEAALQFAKTQALGDDTVFAAFSELVDVDSLTDNLILKTFFGDADTYNQRYWSADGGKLRCIFFDNDLTLFRRSEMGEIVEMYFRTGSTQYAGMVFNAAMRKNRAWRTRLLERYAELTATALSEERLLSVLDAMVEELEPEMARQIQRFKRPRSMASWESSLATLREQLLSRRESLTAQLQAEFRLSDDEMRELLEKARAQEPESD